MACQAPVGIESSMIVTGRMLMAARTDGGGTLTRPHPNLDALAGTNCVSEFSGNAELI
ncbi:hypothetical protein SBA3_1900025 [Candidatus Sulfopaludibacter sp. SbA3]|nr:hypothetical protein SBA3_1900025 [Candidatus Sulfopaludibacter sp. SbA3]